MPDGSESMLSEPPGILHKKLGKYYTKWTKREEDGGYVAKKVNIVLLFWPRLCKTFCADLW